MQSNGHIENTTKQDDEFEASINEPHERVPVVDDEQLRAFGFDMFIFYCTIEIYAFLVVMISTGEALGVFNTSIFECPP